MFFNETPCGSMGMSKNIMTILCGLPRGDETINVWVDVEPSASILVGGVFNKGFMVDVQVRRMVSHELHPWERSYFRGHFRPFHFNDTWQPSENVVRLHSGYVCVVGQCELSMPWRRMWRWNGGNLDDQDTIHP